MFPTKPIPIKWSRTDNTKLEVARKQGRSAFEDTVNLLSAVARSVWTTLDLQAVILLEEEENACNVTPHGNEGDKPLCFTERAVHTITTIVTQVREVTGTHWFEILLKVELPHVQNVQVAVLWSIVLVTFPSISIFSTLQQAPLFIKEDEEATAAKKVDVHDDVTKDIGGFPSLRVL